MSWFGQYLGTTYTGQWWGDQAPTPPQPADTGGARNTAGWVEWLARRIDDEDWRDAVAAEVAPKAPAKVRRAAIERAVELAEGEWQDAQAAVDALRAEVKRMRVAWRDLYGDLLRAYAVKIENERAARVATANELKRHRAAAMLFLLAQM